MRQFTDAQNQPNREAALRTACERLAHSLTTPGKARCMACDERKQPNPGWRVAGYMPRNPAHWPTAYLICDKCITSPEGIRRAAKGVETLSRARAEDRFRP